MLLDRYGMPIETTLAAKQQTNKKVLIELAQQTMQLTRKDIATWRRAWQMAINAENPRRMELYRVYTDVDVDNHLSGAISQVNMSVKQRSFKIMSRDNRKEDEGLTELLEREWFKHFMELVLQSRYWGHSLVELGDPVMVNGTPSLTGVELVSRMHVIPEHGLLLRDPSDDISKGIPYREGAIADWVIEAGSPKDLGLYLKVAPHAISKKNMLGFWDQFGELFGMPIRVARTSNSDPAERSRIEAMLSGMGAAAWGLFPEGTEIDIKESTRGDAFNVYDKRVDRANSEISKAVLTVTMTMDNGASLSQSQVHAKMFKQVLEAEADRIRDIVNNQLLPKLAKLGFPFTPKHLFEWDYTAEYTAAEQTAIDTLVLQHYDVDPKYIVEKYNIPVTGKKAPVTLEKGANGFFLPGNQVLDF